jgi:hypothetical protein
MQHNPISQYQDPVERWVPLSLRLVVYAILAYFFYQAATTFIEYRPLQPWPFFLSTFRMFTFLPIHEAGHLLFRFFGRTLYILGGSFWQVMFPVIWFVIALRQRSQVAPFAAFWIGENLMDVSLYMRDAQFMALPLLGGDSSGHDWKNLLTQWDAVEDAGTIADITYYLGFVICVAAIVAGVFLAFYMFFRPDTVMQRNIPVASTSSPIEDRLDQQISEREDEQKF